MVWFILFVILSLILIILYNSRKRYLENEYKNDFLKQHEEELNELLLQQKQQYQQKFKEEENHFQQQSRILEERKRSIEETIATLNEKKKLLEKQYEEQIAHEKEIIKQKLVTYASVEEEKTKQHLAEYRTEQTAKIAAEVQEFFDKSNIAKAEKQAELDALNILIEDFKKKQQVINEEILRRRQVEEQQDFYRIVLSDQDKEDIHFLISIIGNIKNKQLLYKLIWSEYLQKPFNEMLKRILEGKEVRCVIYKITNLKTGEIYVGKTKAEVSKRWTEHIKTSLNIGTIARSKIHTMLFEHWDEFSFEVLERVSNESLLSSREKFYINFYQSNIYGYNMNSGG